MMHIVTMVLAVALGPGLALAQQPAALVSAAPKKAAKTAMNKSSGKVETVDAAMGKLSVKDKKGTVKEFTIGTDVKITRGGKTISLPEIAAGDTVTVSYSGTAAAPEVKGILVAKAKKK